MKVIQETKSIESFVQACKDKGINVVSFDFDLTLTAIHSFNALPEAENITNQYLHDIFGKDVDSAKKQMEFIETLFREFKTQGIKVGITSRQYKAKLEKVFELMKFSDNAKPDFIFGGDTLFNYNKKVTDGDKGLTLLKAFQNKKILHIDDSDEIDGTIPLDQIKITAFENEIEAGVNPKTLQKIENGVINLKTVENNLSYVSSNFEPQTLSNQEVIEEYQALIIDAKKFNKVDSELYRSLIAIYKACIKYLENNPSESEVNNNKSSLTINSNITSTKHNDSEESTFSARKDLNLEDFGSNTSNFNTSIVSNPNNKDNKKEFKNGRESEKSSSSIDDLVIKK